MAKELSKEQLEAFDRMYAELEELQKQDSDLGIVLFLSHADEDGATSAIALNCDARHFRELVTGACENDQDFCFETETALKKVIMKMVLGFKNPSDTVN